MKRWLLLGVCVCAVPLAWAADVPAVLQWSQRVALSTPVSGVVQAVNVQVGERVGTGQVLLNLDPRRYRARLAARRGAVAKAAADAAEAKRNLSRVQELYNRMVISTTELEQAQLRDARARGVLAEAQARQQLAQRNLADTVLRAPFGGVVLARQAQPGQVVAAGLSPQTLLVLARSGQMLARAMLSESQLAGLRRGQPVAVRVGRQRYAGKIRILGLEPVAGKEGARYAMDVLFPVQQQLRAGTPATVELP